MNRFRPLKQIQLKKITPLSATQALTLSRVMPLTDELLRYAKTNFEIAAARYLPGLKHNFLDDVKEPQGREFLFRCFWVPQFARIEIGWFTRDNKPPPLWLFEAATYLLAFERTHLEMVLRRTTDNINVFGSSNWEKPITVEQLQDLPKPAKEWFIASPDCGFSWMERFDLWRQAAKRSFLYYAAQQCKEVSSLERVLRPASLAGFIEHESMFPPELLPGIREHLKTTHRDALNVFYRNAAKPGVQNDWTEPAFDTWLLEIWPLVSNEGWGDSDLLKIAKKKFITPEHSRSRRRGSNSNARDDDYFFSNSEQIRSRRTKLELQLARKKGRPPKGSTITSPFPTIALFALFVESIGKGENYWLLGQRGLVPEKSG